MSRTHRSAGTIEVKCTQGDPAQFLWRNRLYRVDQVLQQWDRTPVWWQEVRADSRDVRTWRVEASAGRLDAQGVYDLSFDPTRDQWYLIRTFD